MPHLTRSARLLRWAVAPLFALAASGCGHTEGTREAPAPPSAAVAATPQPHAPPPPAATPLPRRNLSVDASMGGHTLSRHVGKSDAELRERLRREPQISAASSYTDRDTAERVVGAALAAPDRGFARWLARKGRRANYVVHYVDTAKQPLGRSLTRGRETADACDHALVVLRWDERRDRYYVLTSYPEKHR